MSSIVTIIYIASKYVFEERKICHEEIYSLVACTSIDRHLAGADCCERRFSSHDLGSARARILESRKSRRASARSDCYGPDRRAMYHFLAGSAGSKKPSRLWKKPSGYQEARFLLSDGYREWSMLSFPASSIRGKLRSLTLGGA